MSKIQVSGWGCVSAIGSDAKETEEAFFAGNVQAKTVADADAYCFIAKAPHESGGTRVDQLLGTAVREAMEAASISLEDRRRLRIGVCLGTTSAINFGHEQFPAAFFQGKAPLLIEDEHFLRQSLARKSLVSLGLRGPDLTLNNACTSGADALGIAKIWIESGVCDLVIAGGVDVTPGHILKGFSSLQLISPEAAKPFDRNRCGLNLGEGAGIMVLESEASAQKRKAEAIGYLLGYGAASDHFHPTSPDPEGKGLSLAIEECLRDAGISVESVSFINAHGTATPSNDFTEGRVFRAQFQGRPMLSTKGYTGHTLAAAGALEAIFSLMFLRRGILPKTLGFTEIDPEIGLEPTVRPTAFNGLIALSTSLGFGGANTALLLEGTHE